MQLDIRTFGIAREICGDRLLRLDLPEPITAGQLRLYLIERYPRLGALASFLLAVNEEYADPEVLLRTNDDIALIPPVSGG